MKNIDMNELLKLKDIEIIDIREPYEFFKGSISNSKNIAMAGLLLNPTNFLNKTKTYYISCKSGGRSYMCCDSFTQEGYDVVNVEGGYFSYLEKKN